MSYHYPGGHGHYHQHGSYQRDSPGRHHGHSRGHSTPPSGNRSSTTATRPDHLPSVITTPPSEESLGSNSKQRSSSAGRNKLRKPPPTNPTMPTRGRSPSVNTQPTGSPYNHNISSDSLLAHTSEQRSPSGSRQKLRRDRPIVMKTQQIPSSSSDAQSTIQAMHMNSARDQSGYFPIGHGVYPLPQTPLRESSQRPPRGPLGPIQHVDPNSRSSPGKPLPQSHSSPGASRPQSRGRLLGLPPPNSPPQHTNPSCGSPSSPGMSRTPLTAHPGPRSSASLARLPSNAPLVGPSQQINRQGSSSYGFGRPPTPWIPDTQAGGGGSPPRYPPIGGVASLPEGSPRRPRIPRGGNQGSEVHLLTPSEQEQGSHNPRKSFGDYFWLFVAYFQFHRVTAPWLLWLDSFKPDVYTRRFKSPHYIKFGRSVETDITRRRRYGWQRFLGQTENQLNRIGHRMLDAWGREHYRINDERYISDWDGGVKELVVQCSDEVFEQENDAHWTRARITDLSPFALRVAEWCQWPAKRPGIPTWRRVLRRVIGGFILLLGNMDILAGRPRVTGKYEPFHYRLQGYSKISRNSLEDPDRWETPEQRRASRPVRMPAPTRAIGPSSLMRIYWGEGDPDRAVRIDTNNWDARELGEPFPQYVFVSYIQLQFGASDPEMELLHKLSMRAAKDAGVSHYWLSCSCMDDPDTEIYRISDIVRASKSVAIAIRSKGEERSHELLEQFGQRVWTLPEILLAPQKDNIFHIYSPGDPSDPGNPVRHIGLTRYQIMRDVWTDAETSRQLVEHFQGNLLLSRLELSVVALKSFYSRVRGPKYNGDREYALMGLLLHRAQVNPDHTEFEAFALLSLLADSDKLLERLICLQPKQRDQKWYDMEDEYGAKLPDIDPHGQVSGIGHGHANYLNGIRQSLEIEGDQQLRDTVIIDGFKAAKVRWKSFAAVHSVQKLSFTRTTASFMLHYSSVLVFVGIIFLAQKNLKLGLPFLIVGAVFSAAAPELLIIRSGGKKWQLQPWLFGVEGYCSKEDLETRIFGTNHGHLKWAPFGSPLCRHKANKFGDVIGLDPMDPETPDNIRDHVERLKGTKEARIFMLIDTAVMTVTMFQAERPPVAFLLGGSEGGMQRAIGVSYDFTTNTAYREVVLRMEGTCADYMPTARRIRLGLRRRN